MEVLIGLGALVGGLTLLGIRSARNEKKMLEKMTPEERKKYQEQKRRNNMGEALKRQRGRHHQQHRGHR